MTEKLGKSYNCSSELSCCSKFVVFGRNFGGLLMDGKLPPLWLSLAVPDKNCREKTQYLVNLGRISASPARNLWVVC
jgi:hypothetical protein